MKKTLSIPLSIETIKEYETQDARFTEVKIWLMHLGTNHHGSHFTREVVEKAIPTLANTPILGFISSDKMGEDDFEGHKKVFEWVDGERKLVYKGIAYGVIPESHNAQFETKVCADGVTREFLTVKGLLWNKDSKAVELLKRDGVKYQSMELYEDAFDGYYNQEGVFCFTDFKFFGACILGEGHSPAMEGASIELAFERASHLKEEIKEVLLAFEKIKEGDLLMAKQVKENVEENTTPIEETPIVEEAPIIEEPTETEVPTVEEAPGGENHPMEEETEPKEEEVKFEAESEEEVKEETEPKEEEKEFETEEVKEEDCDYKTMYEQLLVEHETIVLSHTELVTFKETVLTERRTEEEATLFSKYQCLDGIKEYEDVKSVASQFETVADLEKEIALVFARNTMAHPKVAFEKEAEPQNKYYFDESTKNESNSPYGYLVQKYNK